jgi:hypothetical protein
MIYAQIENGVITQFIETPAPMPAHKLHAGLLPVENEYPELQTGESLGSITATIETDRVVRTWAVVPAPPPRVPDEIQMWQARTILAQSGLLASINAAVAASNNAEIQIAWEYAPNVVRRSTFVATMATALGLTDAQLDAMFIAGALIK